MTELDSLPDAEHTIPQGGLSSPSFQGLLWTQWLTAINDNVFRWFVIGVGKAQFVPEKAGTILVLGSAFFIIPYVVFAPIAGWLADRYAKRTVIIGCKIAEIVIMILGVIAVAAMGSPNPSEGVDWFFYLLLFSVFLMGTQSALFAPAKIGTIPELLTEKSISAGNGLFNLATLSATVIGMALGGWLTDVTARGQNNLWLAGVVLIGIAAIGTLLSLLVRTLPAANALVRFPFNIPAVLAHDISQLFSYRILFRVAMGVVFFWSIAAFAQLNIDVFSEESGGLLESDRTPLLIAVTMGIGFGSVLAGIISAGRIELGLIPLGAMGIVFFSILLWLSPADFIDGSWWSFNSVMVCLLLVGLGMSAGIFDVPVASFLQHNSPIEKRGAILSATNGLAFTGILVLFALLYVFRTPVGTGSIANLPPQYTTADLDTDQVENIRRAVAQLESRPLGDRPDLKPLLDQVDDELKQPALTQLVVADFARRRDAKSSLSFDDYWSEFQRSATELDQLSLEDRDRVLAEERAIGRQIRQSITQAGHLPLLSSRQLFLVMALLAIPVVGYTLYRLSQRFVRLLFYLLFRVLYRVRISGDENFPLSGGAVAVANHSSWLDGAILLVLVPRIPRTIAWAGNFNGVLLQRFASFCGVILMGQGPKTIRRGLEEARDVLNEGEVLGIFPEGGISRHCQVRTFKPGLYSILKKADPVPIVPIYFDELWGSNFSYVGGRAFRRWPWPLHRPLSVHIGKPIPADSTIFEIRQSVLDLSARTMENYASKFLAPPAVFVKTCKAHRFASKIADSTHQEETGGKLLLRSLILRRLLRRHAIQADEQHVGVLIPPSVGACIVNMALALDRRVAINLNYSLSNELINHCVHDAGLKTILTTRKVAQKFDFQFDCKVVYLDDLRDKVTSMDKAIGAFQSYVVPAAVLIRLLGLNRLGPDDPLTIIFTSGSTGVPKGVILTQRNIKSNVEGIQKVASLTSQDTLIGILPFFHSMGYTVTMWTPMISPIRGAYHFNPLDAKVIGKLAEKFDGTIIVATPTFLRAYMRRCTPEQFKSLDMVIAGAERLPVEMCDEFEAKFGVRPVEGYGTTELSPVAAVNIPYSRQSGKDFQVDAKEGTVGRPMPNCSARVTDLDTGEILGPNQAGMLWIAGPNVMKGYLNRPDATADVLIDGWYKTGDVALIDDDGFIKITGRMSRFSKIGGEMVPHLRIEEVLSKFLDTTPSDASDDHLSVAVTAVPDVKKGERLVVLYTPTSHSVEEMQQALKDERLPNLFIPTLDCFFEVEQLPLLGTGKLDLRGIKDLALKKCQPGSE